MELGDEVQCGRGIWVVEMHGDDRDVVHAAVAGVTEGWEPVRIGVGERRGEKDCIVGVRGGEQGFESGGGVVGGG